MLMLYLCYSIDFSTSVYVTSTLVGTIRYASDNLHCCYLQEGDRTRVSHLEVLNDSLNDKPENPKKEINK